MTDLKLAYRALVAALGADAVTDDPDALRAHALDASSWAILREKAGKKPSLPEVLVRPASSADIRTIFGILRRYKIALTPWGLGSSVTGQPLATNGGVVLDLSGLVGLPRLDEIDCTVTVPAGMCGGDLESWLNKREYTLNHFPQSLYRSTVGGWLATRATGHYSSRYGGIESLVTAFTVILADGTEVRLGQNPRASIGPDLKHLFLGSEGTLGVFTEVTLKVFRQAEYSANEAYMFDSLEAGLIAVRRIVQSGLRPYLIRLYDPSEARLVYPESTTQNSVLFAGYHGLRSVAAAEAAAARAIILDQGGRSLGSIPVERWMAGRFDYTMVESQLRLPGGYAETIEVANLWSRVMPMYHEIRTHLSSVVDSVLGHFSHVYDQGTSLYLIVLGQARSDSEALQLIHDVWNVTMEVVLKHNGEISHHHGSGLVRDPWVHRALGSSHDVLKRLKKDLDPNGILNPGKLGFTDA